MNPVAVPVAVQKRLRHRAKANVTWCPGCATSLANEQVIDERMRDPLEPDDAARAVAVVLSQHRVRRTVARRPGKVDWPDHVKQMQRNWIGRRSGHGLGPRMPSGREVEAWIEGDPSAAQRWVVAWCGSCEDCDGFATTANGLRFAVVSVGTTERTAVRASCRRLRCRWPALRRRTADRSTPSPPHACATACATGSLATAAGGTPVPVAALPECGVVPVELSALPVIDGDRDGGQKPCPRCGGAAEPDPDNLDVRRLVLVFLRHLDRATTPKSSIARAPTPGYPSDLYVGSIAYATSHLVYARFVTKALRDPGSAGHRRAFQEAARVRDHPRGGRAMPA